MTETCEIEIFIAMNEDGGFVVTSDEGEALTKLGEDEGGYAARVVKIIVKMSPPVITESTVVVPNEAGQTVETTA